MIDCAIIGGGPAGLTAGLYATRGGLKEVVIYEISMLGGQITKSSEIENYPGFFDNSKTGMDFMDTWQKQCFNFGLKHKMNFVTRVEKKDNYFNLTMKDGAVEQAKTVIVATGSNPKSAGVKGEDIYYGKGVSSCATCDGFFHRNKVVAVIGGGDTALEEAYFLSNICKEVNLYYRKDNFDKIAPSTVERAMKKNNINLILNSVIEEIKGDEDSLSSISILNTKTKEQTSLDISGLFVFVGHNVNNSLLKDDNNNFICNMSKSEQVIVDLNMNTNISGLFVAGDLRINAPKQVVSAAGDGSVAALQVISYLQELE